MKKLILSAALLVGAMAFAQEQPAKPAQTSATKATTTTTTTTGQPAEVRTTPSASAATTTTTQTDQAIIKEEKVAPADKKAEPAKKTN